jgi:hypothetical protein
MGRTPQRGENHYFFVLRLGFNRFRCIAWMDRY